MSLLRQKIDALSPEKRAVLFKRLRARTGALARARLEPRAWGVERPLSFAQQRLWFLDRLHPGRATYLCPAALRFRGRLRIDLLHASIAAVLRRHEVLRASFPERPEGVTQVIGPPVAPPLPIIDLTALSSTDRLTAAARLARADARHPFDLARGPLLRLQLLRLAADDAVLLVTLHHIVCDAWSVGVWMRELTALYVSACADAPAPLPALPVQYADFAAWQADWLRGPALEEELRFWRTRLDGLAPLDLPTDRPRPASFSDRAGALGFALPPEDAAAIQQVCEKTGATRFMLLLAAWQLLLSRYVDRTDIAVGTPVANRTQRETEALIGCCVNTVVLRTRWRGRLSFRALLAQVRETVLDLFAHQELPFEKLVEELAPSRDASRSPLFDVLLSLDQDPPPLPAWPGLLIEPFGQTPPVARCDLTLAWTALPDGALSARLEYAADLFDASTMDRMMRQLATALACVAADVDRDLQAIDLLPAAERTQLIVDRNATTRSWPSTPVHVWQAAQADRTPTAIAVACGAEQISHRALHTRARRIANHLRALGVRAETPVGLGMSRGADMLAALLGVMHAGGAYVPLDPDYPADRLAYMLSDAGARVLLTDRHTHAHLSPLAPASCLVVAIDATGAALASAPDTPSAPIRTGQLAYIIYTSGSTGRPKGVAVTHDALSNFIHAIQTGLGISAADRLVAITALSFDIAALELYVPLLSGARVIVAPRDVAHSAPALIDCLETQQATMLQATPATWEQLCAVGWTPPPDLAVLCGGEALRASLAATLVAGCGVVWNLYGPTETTIWSACAALTRATMMAGVPIGGPIANTQLYVLDREGDVTPTGVPGELHIGGAGLARGYLGQPALTAASFVPDPFGAPGARLYRTGDRVRWRPGAGLTFLGREDAQVKLRGHRIEPGEIEAALERCAGVRQAVVIVREDVPGDLRLVAYVVADADVSDAALRAAVRERLPEYMTPAAFVRMDALPVTPNRKVNRKALPAPDYVAASTHWRAPRTAREEALCALFAEVLAVDRLGLDDDFFALGGHSLLATRLVSRIRTTLDVDVPIRTLFERSTVGQLSAALHDAGRAQGAIAPQPRPPRIPLSHAQQRLWFIDQLEGTTAAYNMPQALRLRGALDPVALRRAVETLVDRHESLRTRFVAIDGAPAQVIEPFAAIDLPVEDLSEQSEAIQSAHLADALRQEAATPFELTRAPMLRLRLLKQGAHEHVLLHTTHHIVSDGWSQAVFNRELIALYNAYREDQPNPLDPLPLQYADFALWQRRWLDGGALDAGLSYWSVQLAGVPPWLELPTDRPRAAVQTFDAAARHIHVPPALTDALRRASRAQQATLYMTLLTALSIVLSRHSGQDDVVIGSPIANRQHTSLESLIGFFVNALVLRVRVRPERAVEALWREVRQTALDAYQHQDVPFERIVEAVSPQRHVNTSPLFQVSFAMQNAPWPAIAPRDLTVEPVESDDLRVRVDLEIHVWERDGALDIEWLYNRDLFDDWRMTRMAEHVVRLLGAMAEEPTRLVRDLPMLGEAERRQLLHEWSGARTPSAEPHADAWPREMRWPDAFEQQAACRPRATAIVSDDEVVSYETLNARANQLAHRLLQLGIGAEDVVGLALPRSIDMVVALLAVAKAGAAYLPLDPRDPAARIDGILRDAGARVLLTADRASRAADEPPTVVTGVSAVTAVTIDLSSRHAQSTLARLSAHDPTDADRRAPRHAAHPAYVIYTSGSTGQPKGVVIAHGALSAYLAWARDTYDLSAGAGAPVNTPLAFDATVTSLYLPLLTGQPIVLASETQTLEALASLLTDGTDWSLVKLTPAHLHGLRGLLDTRVARAAARRFIVGGEALSAADAAFWREHVAGLRLINEYGPTEATVGCCIHEARDEDAAASAWLPIGRPTPGTCLRVLDAELEPSPAGVLGELCIGGAQLARGYLHRPALTAERFVPDPFGPPGARLYRTGDRAHWLHDGTLAFDGRADAQIKLRGYRIEPGEIAAALRHDPRVREAVVAVHGEHDERRLVAYVTPRRTAEDDAAARSAQVSRWQQLYESIYRGESAAAADFNLAGWTSSYTGEALPADEMRAWVEETVARVRALRPRRVLEIGCGAGLLLTRLAGACERYIGLDFAEAALRPLAALVASREDLRRVELRRGTADDLAWLPDGAVDLVIINSVAQYFPDVDYLLAVLDGAQRVTAAGGHVFIGDVRNRALQRAYATSVELHRASAETPVTVVNARIDARLQAEEELVIDPALFRELARRAGRAARVELWPKTSAYDNELSRFRYDAVLRIGPKEAIVPPTPARWVTWDAEGRWSASVARMATEAPGEAIGLRDLRDRRVAPAMEAVRLLRERGAAGARLAEDVRRACAEATEPADEAALGSVVRLADALGVALAWETGREPGFHDVIFNPQWRAAQALPDADAAHYRAFANVPARAASDDELGPALRESLRSQLPEYMLPSAIVSIEEWPLTANGKLDWSRLPEPAFDGVARARGATAAHDPIEEMLAGILATVLKRPRVGRDEDFFALGGHSLMAVQVVARVRAALQVDLPVRALFETPTAAGLARTVDAARRAGAQPAIPPLQAAARPTAVDSLTAEREMPLPLSFAQRRLWFLQQLSPESAAYHMPAAVRLTGPLDAEALRAALSEVVRRHEALRTCFPLRDGEPEQRILAPAPAPLPVIDLSPLPMRTRERAAGGLARAAIAERFDLAHGPLFRVRLLRLDTTDHVLLLETHHVISDGWSMGLLLDELTRLYEAARSRRPVSPLAPLPVQYADVAIWQRSWLHGALLDAQRDYWRAQLADAPTLDLPTDHPRPPVASSRGAEIDTRIDAELTERLARWSQARGVTLFMTLATACQAVLGRYAGQRDVVIGTPVANRTPIETERVIGCFVNTLVLRARWTPKTTVSELVTQVRETVLDAHAHRDVPFEQLVEDLAPARDLSRSPLFQVLLTLQQGARLSRTMGDLSLTPFAAAARAARFDLAIDIWEEQDELRIRWEYATDLFARETIDRIARHYRHALASLLEHADCRVEALPLLTSVERTQLLTSTQGAARSYPATPLPLWIDDVADATPDAIALEAPADAAGGVAHVSYGALMARALAIGARLREAGAGPETLIGVALSRGVDLAAALIGLLRIGAAYVPLDSAQPRERLLSMVADADLRILITDAREAEPLAALAAGRTVVTLDAASARAARQHADAATRPSSPLATIAPSQLAYVIFTSGSTGRPKGVGVSHGALTNFLRSMQEQLRITPDDRLVAVTTLSFDIAGLELYLPLVSGARVILASRETAQSGEDLAALLESRGATRLQATPATWVQLDAAGWRAPASLHMLCGGEALPPALAAKLRRGAGPLWNLYGPTETTIWSMAARLDTVPDWGVPLGAPIANTPAYVLDEEGEPAPIGVAGELCIGGAGVARGYINDPARTAAQFVPDPTSGAGARMYRTGDRVRRRADGAVEFLGRRDHQVKLRGHRIELAEIERALLAHPWIDRCIVLRREDTPGDPRLVAYIVAPDGVPSAEELRRSLQARLPEYMVPRAFVAIDALPLTPNGKIDRRALPAPASDAAESDGDEPPRGAIEEIVAEVWAGVLQQRRLSRHADFFALGGHSLLAMQAVARLRTALRVEAPVRWLFEAPTVARFAQRIAIASGDGGVAPLPPLVPVSRDEPLPLSFAQQRFWFLHQLDPASAAYQVPAAVRLTGDLRVAALRASLTAVAERHEALRTTFVSVDGSPVQRINAAADVPLPIVDLSACASAADRERLASRLALVTARRPFDLAGAPLLRVLLLRLDARAHLLLVTLHHAIADQWSLGLLLRELIALYTAARTGLPASLPTLPVQSADVAVWQRAWLQGARLEAQLQYWRARLADLQPLALPTDAIRSAVDSDRAAEITFTVPATVTEAARTLARAHGVTLFATALAALQVLLGRHAGQRDAAIGAPIAGRTQPELEPLIGCFVNTLVLRAGWDARITVETLLAQVRETLLDAHAHQDVPFEKLVEELAPARDGRRSPFFQTVLTLAHRAPRAPQAHGLAIEPFALGYRAARFDLTVALEEDDVGALSGRIEYPAELFDAVTVERLAERFTRLLSRMAADPASRVAAIDLSSEAERAELLSAAGDASLRVNRVNRVNPADRADADTVIEQFRAQVSRRPDAIAIEAGAAHISYAALTQRVTRLSRRLRVLGASPEAVVCVGLDRGPDAIIALLGILDSGAAYLPLDLASPPERLARIARHANARILVTNHQARSRIATVIEAGTIVAVDDSDVDDSDIRDDAAGERLGGNAQQLAYVMYTSGSTGEPKGVAITQDGILRLVIRPDFVRIDADDVFLQLAPLSFDASTFEIWGSLLNGARLVICPPEAASLDAMGDVIARARVSVLWLTAGLFHEMLDYDPSRLALVRQLLAGGEALSPTHVSRAVRRLSDTRIINGYGPTENTTFTCCHAIPPSFTPERTVAIGRPIAGTRVYVLDDDGALAPPGSTGELYASGAGLARGYLRNAALTAERFVPDPFDTAGGRLYRTGDRVRWRADGTLEFLGRLDQQIKLRGFRIEPGEIETLLNTHQAVQQSAVITREDAGTRRLVAYVVPTGVAPDTAILRDHLRARLPDYMTPGIIVCLDRLPLTTNGKLDVAALPAPVRAGASDGESRVARHPSDEIVASLWSELLHCESVGDEDDFFELGGHSLLATRLITRIRAALDVDLPLRTIFDAASLRAFSAEVERVRRARGGATLPAIEPVSRHAVLPLSSAQRRLWFLARLDPSSAAYHVPMAIALRGALRHDALRASLSAVVRRHEALRTSFGERDGEPVQIIAPPAATPLPVVDLTGVSPEARTTLVRRIARREAGAPFDLSRGPLLRARLIACGAADHVLLLTMHHIVSDGWSMGILLRELTAFYAGLIDGRAPAWPALRLQYADIAAWQHTWLQGDERERQLRYWREQLADLPRLDLPVDVPRAAAHAAAHAASVAQLPIAIPSDVLRRLRQRSREAGATLFMTTLAAFQLLLGRDSSQQDVAVGVPAANRNRGETEALIGFFVNTLVLRTRWSAQGTFRTLLRQTRETVLDGYAHEDLPFDTLVEALAPARESGRAPLFQVELNMLHAPAPATHVAGLELRELELPVTGAKVDLSLVLTQQADELRGALIYDAARFAPARMARFRERLLTLLSAISHDLDQPLAALVSAMDGDQARRAAAAFADRLQSLEV